MRLLQPIYSSPTQLLEKARRDGDRLVTALFANDEQDVRDALFDFAVSAFHVWDWVKVYRPDLVMPVTSLLNTSEPIKACRDLCNASKHVDLDLNRKHPLVVEAPRYSATSSGTPSEPKDFMRESGSGESAPLPAAPPAWRLKVTFKSGRPDIRAEDLVPEVLREWDKFFAEHAIK